MESASGDKRRNLTRALKENPTAFDFFEVIRRMDNLVPDSPRTGWGSGLEDEALRFGQDPSLAFPPNTIASFHESGGVSRLSVNFIGLLGPNGPMPLHFTEYVRDRSYNNLDPTWQRFLDIFHHRTVALFYRAWALSEQAVSYDRPDEDWFADAISSVIGTEAFEGSSASDPSLSHAKLYWAGRMISSSRNAEGLSALLTDFFEMPVETGEFVACWIEMPEIYRCVCGGNPANATLGESAFLGAKNLTASEKIKVSIGPIGLEDFERMLPGTRSFERLGKLVMAYLAKPLFWELSMTLKKEEVPETSLGAYGRLGYTTWIKSKQPDEDDSSFSLSLGASFPS